MLPQKKQQQKQKKQWIGELASEVTTEVRQFAIGFMFLYQTECENV